MDTSSLKTIRLAGIAIFSMFFGAGNVIFPLQVGINSGYQTPWALFGLLVTAIGGPLLGLVGATLYQGRCLDFFCRPGRKIGVIFIAVSLLLLGPFAVIPRCFVVAYSSFHAIFQDIPLPVFSLFFGIIALVCCFREKFVLPILGRIFSPILIISLLLIIFFGIYAGTPLIDSNISPTDAFISGLECGYDTMDLIAAIFFSSSIWGLLSLQLKDKSESNIAKTTIYSGLLGGGILGLIYVGLAFATAFNAEALSGIAPEQLMSTLSFLALGPYMGIIANLAIVVACFTTIVSLSQTIASLCAKEFFPKRINYRQSLTAIILISVSFSLLGFGMINSMIHPLIVVCYPAIIVLTLCNISHKIYGLSWIKTPVYGTLSSSALKTLFLFGGL